MDRQTDGQTELRWLKRATAVAAVARKKIQKYIKWNMVCVYGNSINSSSKKLIFYCSVMEKCH